MELKDYLLVGFGIVMMIVAAIKNIFFNKKDKD